MGRLPLDFSPSLRSQKYLFLKIMCFVKAGEGCKYRDHKVKVRNPKDSEMYLTLMTHR